MKILSESLRPNARSQPALGWKPFILLVAIIVCFSVPGLAQDMSTIIGLVTDSSGAVVPNVKVTVANPEKAINRVQTTNSAGEYLAAKIPLGTYEVTAEGTGFQKLVRTGISLDAGVTLRVDLQLTVGQVTQEITVSGGAAKVNTENASVSSIITGAQVKDLNLDGRNWMSLTQLVPGVAVMNTNNFDPSHAGFGSSQLIVSFSGSRYNDSNVDLDGGNINNETGGGRNNIVFPVIDSIAEFNISTSTYGADTGKRPGASIQIVSKSGTKGLHGTMYEFVRNNDLDANSWSLNRAIHTPAQGGSDYNAFKQPLKWNTFGYNIGGPFYIPGHYNDSKTKTFFFWNQGWQKYREGAVITAGVPTLRMRQGDFSECHVNGPNYIASVASNCKLPIDPATGLTMDTLAQGGYSIDPNALTMLNGLVPLPNSGPDGYTSAPSLPNNWRQDNIRVDQNISANTRLFVRYTGEIHVYDGTQGTYNSVVTIDHFPTKNILLNLNHSFSPTLLNELIVDNSRVNINFLGTATSSSPDGQYLKPSSWTAGPLFAANKTNSQAQALPYLAVSGGLPISWSASTGDIGVTSAFHSGNIRDNLIKTVGKHTLKMGFFMLDLHTYAYNGGNPAQGSFTFSNSGSLASGNTGNGLANMYLGQIQQYNESTGIVNGTPQGGWGHNRQRMKDYETYIQDDFKFSRRLTFNLGLRYAVRGSFHDASNPNRDSGFNFNQYVAANEAQLDANTRFVPGTGQTYATYGNGLIPCGTGGVPNGCLSTYYGAIQPRLGFAYDLTGSGKTVIRGGVGLFTDSGFSRSPSAVLAYGPPPYGVSPTLYNINGYANIASGTLVLAPTAFRAFPEKGIRPRVAEYNLTLEHEFTGNNVLSVAYVGLMSRHLDRDSNIDQIPLNSTTVNAPALAGRTDCDSSGNCNVQATQLAGLYSQSFFVPYRGYTSIQYITDTGVSNYNSLQSTLRHTVGRGLTLGLAYTYSHAIDNSSDGAELTSVDDWNNLSRWRGLSQFDRTNILQANYVYNLPFFRNSSSHFVRNGLGGWQVSGITSFFGGVPQTFTCTPTNNANGKRTGIGTSARCNSLGNFKIYKSTINDTQYGPTPGFINPATIGMPYLSQLSANGASGMFGYIGRDPIHGPGRDNFDIALMKNFSLPWFGGEHSNLQFRWETFNTFNHTQFQNVSIGCGASTTPGAPCSDSTNNNGNGELTTPWNPRQMQFGLKYTF